MREHWFELKETGNERYPRYYLTHWHGRRGYTVMIYDAVQKRWFPQAEQVTIREARACARNFIALMSAVK